jgi:hypothetical protein
MTVIFLSQEELVKPDYDTNKSLNHLQFVKKFHSLLDGNRISLYGENT